MIGRLMRYGGVSGKVRAMHGKRITRDDYARLIRARGLSELVAMLKAHPGWNGALQGISPQDVHRFELEGALRRGVDNEYIKIFKFMQGDDAKLMAYRLLRGEMEELLTFLHYLSAGNPEQYAYDGTDFFKEHSKVNFDALPGCRTYAEMLEITRGSIFQDALREMGRKYGEDIHFAEADVTLRSVFFRRVEKIAEKRYKGEVFQRIKMAFGTRADMMNILAIIRIKRHFPEMTSDILSYVVPYYGSLSFDVIRQLYSAPDEQSLFHTLRQTSYSKIFSGVDYSYPEQYYYKAIYDFNRARISREIPSVYTPMAYMEIKETELQNLIYINECVHYGLSPEAIGTYLIGF